MPRNSRIGVEITQLSTIPRSNLNTPEILVLVPSDKAKTGQGEIFKIERLLMSETTFRWVKRTYTFVTSRHVLLRRVVSYPSHQAWFCEVLEERRFRHLTREAYFGAVVLVM